MNRGDVKVNPTTGKKKTDYARDVVVFVCTDSSTLMKIVIVILAEFSIDFVNLSATNNQSQ